MQGFNGDRRLGESILPHGDSEVKLTMETIDNVSASPNLRAVIIHTVIKTHLPHVTVWDLICFCAEYLGTIVEAEPWIKPIVRHISKLVYIAHYYHGRNLDSCVLPTGELLPLPANLTYPLSESDTTKSKA